MSITNKLKSGLKTIIDIRDVFLIGGWGMLGAGLYLKWDIWLALIVDGVLLMIIGYLMQDK